MMNQQIMPRAAANPCELRPLSLAARRGNSAPASGVVVLATKDACRRRDAEPLAVRCRRPVEHDPWTDLGGEG